MPTLYFLTPSGAPGKTHLAASFMPQSSEQYLEAGWAARTQPGPRHCGREAGSLGSALSGCFHLSLCFCFCRCRLYRSSFCRARHVMSRCSRGQPGTFSAFARQLSGPFPIGPLPSTPPPPPAPRGPSSPRNARFTLSITFFSDFFSRRFTCFTFTARFLRAGSRNGDSSASLIQGCKQGMR